MLAIDVLGDTPMAEQEPKKVVPPYVSYKAFARLVQRLRDDGLPSRIDRGVLDGMSGSGQSTMINGLIALGLVVSDGRPTPALKALVSAPAESQEYKDELRKVLQRTYPFLFGGAINLKTTTTNEMQEAFRAQGASGSTVAKGIAFFITAARETGIEISKFVRTPTITEVGSKKRNSSRPAAQSAAENGDDDEDDIPMGPGIDLHPALTGVLATLPAPGQPMSEKERNRFMAAFDAVLHLAHPLREDPA